MVVLFGYGVLYMDNLTLSFVYNMVVLLCWTPSLYCRHELMGKKYCEVVKLKSSLEHLIAVHCFAHRMELGGSKSLQDHPLKTFE